MKINWGTGIVLAFIGFISFILFFVVRMGMDDSTNHDLVREDYYKAEIGFQKELDAEINANENNVNLNMVRTPAGIKLEFPKDLDQATIKGTVSLYRPSNKQLDFDFPISLSNNHLIIPENRLVDGRWDLKVSWEYNGEAYMYKEKITH
ncbi:hypothetical protein KCTC52924_00777 [Arenibacter antarcticus]|uniref:FixH family protein n=1 Tax=Arenibacter antarcticus TaxID=2040469 RepID=A0ABW5VDG4_9FLAO|nr:FixH family protein [Arenibacter sp. H213]MCM4167709.1 cytochrome C oxidase Cbb3 [Arenibacter sp. H213]